MDKKALRPDISYIPIKFRVLWHGRIEILHRKNKALHTHAHTPVFYIHLVFMNGRTKTWHFDNFRKYCIPLLWTEYLYPLKFKLKFKVPR